MSSNLRKRISKFCQYNKDTKQYTASAILIGQIGKNFFNDYNKLITGDELLKITLDTVSVVHEMIGGKLVYLECENVEKLTEFYASNGFFNFGERLLDLDEKSYFKEKSLIQMLKYNNPKNS